MSEYDRLERSALQRRDAAYRPGSQKIIKATFRSFLAYAIKFRLDLAKLTSGHILAYIELLINSGLSQATVANKVSNLRCAFQNNNIPHKCLWHRDVTLILKGSKSTIRQINSNPGVFSVVQLERIIKACNYYKHPKLFKAVYTLAFHAFLRISNIAPVRFNRFDQSRHLCRGDVLWNKPEMHIILKWSKTLQSSNNHQTIPLLPMSNQLLCPVSHLLSYLNSTTGLSNDPLFAIIVRGRLISISHLQIRTHLRKILLRINVNSKKYGFHTFRRTGATLAEASGVSYKSIQDHGTWKSAAVETYLCRQVVPPTVPLAFQALLGKANNGN